MHPLLLHNGRLTDTREKFLSPGQVGVLNGWGVFTTIRVYDGVMFAWQRHWDRMARDARKMNVPMPAAEDLEAQLQSLIEANQAHNSTLRVSIIRNRGGMFETPGIESDYDIVAFTRDVAAWGESAKLGIVPQARHAQCEFAGTKILSWSQNLTWYERAKQQGLDEVVLLNERNEVSECTSANIFIVQGGRIYTPAVMSSGCLAGITRDVIVNDLGLEVHEHILLLADLTGATEVFMTSTTREVMPVTYLDQFGHIPIGPVTLKVREAFSAFTKAYTESHKKAALPA
ncbi:4-amino-4-deoxychorismate lyase [Bryobacterales bacterium F-183]|nr:4-amino-4-deoxychorismate lyase [Bryobacterales bacterium F-183]